MASVRLFVAVSAFIAVVLAAEGTVVITGCQNGATTSLEDSDVDMYCYHLTTTSADGRFHWTLTTENGAQIPLGTCLAVNSCTSAVTNAGITRSSAAMSRLRIANITKNMTGEVACTVRSKSGEGTDTCRVNVVRILFSKDMIELSDGKKGSSERVQLSSATERISTSLTLTTESGRIALGNCTTVQYKCASQNDILKLSIFSKHLLMTPKTATERRFAGNLSISVTFGSERVPDHIDIPLTVYSPPQVDGCSIEVHQHTRTAVLACDVLKAFSSAGLYQFQVLEFSPNSSFIYKDDREGLRIAKNSTELKRHERRSFRPNVQSYEDATDNKTYYRGRLQYSWKMSSFNKDFKYVSILVCTSLRIYGCSFPDPWFFRLPKSHVTMDHQDCECDCDCDQMKKVAIALGVVLALTVAGAVVIIIIKCFR